MTQDPVTALTAALTSGHELDLAGGELPASALVTVLTAPRPAGAPALRLRRARITGVLRLTGADVTVPVDLRGCTFDEAPDLRKSAFVGLSLSGCRRCGAAACACAPISSSTTGSPRTAACT